MFPLKIFEILRTGSGWWLSKLSQSRKNIFKVCNVVRYVTTIDVILMSSLYLEILLGLRILQESLHASIYAGLFLNKTAGWKPITSSTREIIRREIREIIREKHQKR